MVKRTSRDLSNSIVRRVVKQQNISSQIPGQIPITFYLIDVIKKMTLPVAIILLLFSIYIFSKNHELLSFFNTKSDNTTEAELTANNSEEPSQRIEVLAQKDEPINDETQQVIKKVQVEVLNGCGVAGIASKVTKYLRDIDIDVVGRDNYKNFNVKESFLIDRVGNKDRALKVAESLGLTSSNIQIVPDSNLQLDVTIVLGSNYKNLKPFNN